MSKPLLSSKKWRALDNIKIKQIYSSSEQRTLISGQNINRSDIDSSDSEVHNSVFNVTDISSDISEAYNDEQSSSNIFNNLFEHNNEKVLSKKNVNPKTPQLGPG